MRPTEINLATTNRYEYQGSRRLKPWPDRDEALAGVQALALRVLAELLENRETPAEFLNVTFQAA